MCNTSHQADCCVTIFTKYVVGCGGVMSLAELRRTITWLQNGLEHNTSRQANCYVTIFTKNIVGCRGINNCKCYMQFIHQQIISFHLFFQLLVLWSYFFGPWFLPKFDTNLILKLILGATPLNNPMGSLEHPCKKCIGHEVQNHRT